MLLEAVPWVSTHGTRNICIDVRELHPPWLRKFIHHRCPGSDCQYVSLFRCRMKLPPLQSIRAFEAIARLGSVTGAASELSVTHSAVSHQIRNLEQWIGIPLIERNGRGIRLTEAGERYGAVVCPAFERIYKETELLQRQPYGAAARVSCVPMFAVSWLLPQLPEFWAKHPEIQISLHYSRDEPEISPEIDVGVYFGRANDFKDFLAIPLLPGTEVPVGSPSYLEKTGYKSLDDLPKLTLLNYHYPTFWSDWLKRAGLPGPLAGQQKEFLDGNLALAATMAGEGVMLASKAVVASQLRSRTLVPLSERGIHDDAYYLILTPKSRSIPRNALIFVQWLQSLSGTLRLGVPQPSR